MSVDAVVQGTPSGETSSLGEAMAEAQRREASEVERRRIGGGLLSVENGSLGFGGGGRRGRNRGAKPPLGPGHPRPVGLGHAVIGAEVGETLPPAWVRVDGSDRIGIGRMHR